MPHLDALRGIAALIVVVSHSANAGLLPSIFGRGFGQMGVGLFYVLSAFLLTTLYVRKNPSGPIIGEYLLRRVARVLPLFYAALFASFILEAVTGQSVYSAFNSTSAALNNIFLIHGTSVLWSIPVEIQFYFIFIAFWLISAFFGSRLSFLFLIVFQIAIGVIALALDFHKHSLPFWMHFFTFGCLLAHIARNKNLSDRVSGSSNITAFLILVILLTPLLLPAVRADYLGLGRLPIFIDPISLLWVLCVSLIFVFSILPRTWVDNGFFRLLGELSFGAYLIHMAVIKAVDKLPFESVTGKLIGFALVVVLTYATAAFVNKYFERPAQKWLLKFRSLARVYRSQ